MSAVKFNYPTYKLFEPQYHPQRPIIIDADSIESPETVTLRYEEEAAARANGGDLRGDSPPGLLGIGACPKPEPPPMHSAFDSPRPYQDAQYPYAGQPFGAQQTENAAAAQLNHLAFAANSSASQYMPPIVPTLTSYQPTSGGFGTKSPAHAIRDGGDASGLGCVVSGDAPQLEDTRILSGNVPISLSIESADGQILANIDVGTFTYDTQVVGAEGSHEDITRRPSSKSHEDNQSQQQQQQQQHTTSPKHEPQQEADQLTEAAATATNTYPYAPATQLGYDATGYSSNTNNNMLSTSYRSSYGADYPRAPPPPLLKTPSWAHPYGSSLTSPRSPPSIHHATISRSAVTTLPMPTSGAPQLIRTSTLQAASSSNSSSMHPYAMYSAKAVLKINGDLESMASGWTPEECENGRRIVMFSKKQTGATLSTTFKPVSVNERPPNGIFISCIYWNEKRECFVTSVDTISLLEQLLAAPSRFPVEEKNRIRRNLEGFRPLTVSKAKPDSEEFFKTIMGFPTPKPRNIEKDVKVFPWKILAPALKKIISKYSASPSNSSGIHHSVPPSYHPSSGPPALLTPVSSTSPGLYGPPQTPTLADSSYAHQDSQTMASPRSLPGAPSSWAPYTARTLSPSLKSHSPQSGVRIPSLPSYTNPSTHGYGMASHRWDANGYGDAPAAPAYASHQHHPSHVYGTSAYGGSAHHRE